MTVYDCLIVGGGIAGLQAAIQIGRYGHSALVADKADGRSTLCRSYHNVLGWPDGISGDELRRLGRTHAERTGVRFVKDEIVSASRRGDTFELVGRDGGAYEAKTVLLATGIVDRFPDLPGLVPCLGKTVYVCPDCDGHEVRNRKTIVMGSGDTGAGMAMVLSAMTADLVFVNHERQPIRPDLAKKLRERDIVVVNEAIADVLESNDGEFQGVKLAGGGDIWADRGFIAFGGNEVRSGLAGQLGAERHENGHIMTDARTKMTTVPNLWAAGDVGVHSEQVAIAMGEGIQAAIWMHKALLRMGEEAPAEARPTAAGSGV
ncbi:NAD(P)/FAD-dependent oxidoreductase [Paenibacillus flagellatus]|uniref:Pyridine nucleotide-disulfide oxidoreductase n=1 Tax=Paenibacillus flagellatus TaxID=2211139 RepID=A0A2V5KPF4_9BACL|nr:NAD(P)/FAD-dependent oxidoreductase [Paenibacillus flagellatus]PYI57350.1 pyridine nucleotide-disulfide oxidoreductase [Paenibacillus flagellatus]